MAGVDYNLTLKITAENQAKAELEKMNSQITNIGKVIWWWAVWKTLLNWVKGFANEILTLWWNLEQAEVAFTTMLWSGEEATKMLKDLTDFAKKTPFELVWIRDNAKQLMAMWISADDLIPTLKMLGDVSAWLSVDLGRVALNYWQVATQWKLTGMELRDFTRMWIPLIKELAKYFWVAEEEIQKMVSAGKVGFEDVKNVFEQMTWESWVFENLMDKQSKTFQGMVSNLQDSFTSIRESIWRALLPILERILPVIANIVEKLADWVEANPELASTLTVIVAWWIALVWVLSWLWAILPIITAWITTLTWPIWWVAGAIALLATAWINDWGGIRETTEEVTNRISAILWPRFEKLWAWRKEHGETVMIYVEEIMGAIADTIWTCLEIVAVIVAWTLETITAWVALFKAIRNGDWEEVNNIAVNRAQNIDEMLTNAFWDLRTNIKNAFREWIDTVLGWVESFVGAIEWVVDRIKNAWNNVRSAAQSVVQSAKSKYDSAVASLKSLVSWWKAGWWPVTVWNTYLVGEKWPELFVPNQSGKIIPNNEITNNNWITINISWVSVRNDNDIQELAKEMIRQVKLEKNFWIA